MPSARRPARGRGARGRARRDDRGAGRCPTARSCSGAHGRPTGSATAGQAIADRRRSRRARTCSEELAVAVGARDRRERIDPDDRQPGRGQARRHPRRAPRGAPAGRERSHPCPTAARPASNWGFTSRTSSASGVVQRSSAGATVSSEMNERSATASGTGPPMASGSSARTLVRSSTRDARVVCAATTRAARGRRRPRRPCAAPRCSRQSVKPPVDAPASRARQPTRLDRRTAASAASSFSPPRDT